MRPKASFSSLALRPFSSVNTFRSTLPGMYGQGDGFVTKNLGKRNGALTSTRPPKVTELFMRPVNAEEKTLLSEKTVKVVRCAVMGCCPSPREAEGEGGARLAEPSGRERG